METKREGKKTRDESEPGPGFGRGRPLTAEEKEDIARTQAELIRTGKTRKGTIILDTPLKRAIFVGGLIGIIVLALLIVAMA